MRTLHSLLCAVCSVGPLTLAFGCAGTPESGVPIRPEYPVNPNRLRTLDIQVRIEDDGQTVTMTNTTAIGFGPARLWINEWYSHAIDGMNVGETLRIPVGAFHDTFGEPIRGGGFFATRAAEPVSKAELQTDEGIYGLVVVANAQ